MFGVECKVQRAARPGEVVKSDAGAGAEIPNRCSARRSFWNFDRWGKLVGGI